MKSLLWSVGLAFVSTNAHAAASLQSVASPPSVARGDTVSVSLAVDALTPPLGCFSVALDYDPSSLRFVDAVEGSLFAGAAAPTFFGVSLDTTGVEVVSDCLLGFGTSIAGPGEIAVLRFETLVDGVASLSYKDVALRDVDRALILPVSVDTVSVAVGVTSTAPRASAWNLVTYPNPAIGRSRLSVVDRSGHEIRFAADLGVASASILVHDVAGRLVRRLTLDASGVAAWDGRDENGTKVAGGLYFATLRAGELRLRTKILRLDG